MHNVVTVLGSPRRNGNSATLAQNVSLGAKSSGANVETYFIHGMDIKPCNACGKCRKELNDGCDINDDMQKIYPKLYKAEAIVIATPIYWFTVSAQTKLFLDRCSTFRTPGGYALNGKRIGIVMTYKASDPFVAGAVNAIRTFQDMFAYIDAKIVGMVYGKAHEPGEIAGNFELMNEAFELGKRLVLQI